MSDHRWRSSPISLSTYQFNQYVQVGGQATYRSHIFGGTLLAANQGTVLPDYWRFDAFVEGYFLKNYEWKIYVNNIFNKLYHEPPRVFRRPFRLSHAAKAGCSSMA